jgi:hypothetical protein
LPPFSGEFEGANRGPQDRIDGGISGSIFIDSFRTNEQLTASDFKIGKLQVWTLPSFHSYDRAIRQEPSMNPFSALDVHPESNGEVFS